MIFSILEIIWDLILVDLGFFIDKSIIGVWWYENMYFQFSVMLYDIVKLEKLVLLF
jgi:hypothetical protein